MRAPPFEVSHSAERALAELCAAVTSYLVDPSGLLKLVDCRDRAERLLSRSSVKQRCDCGARSGFHAASCAVVVAVDSAGVGKPPASPP